MFARTMFTAVLAGVISLAIVSAAAADDTKPIRLAGKIAKIDGKTVTITSETDGKDVSVTCNDATKIIRDGQKDPITLADLTTGLKVRAYYDPTTGIASLVAVFANQ